MDLLELLMQKLPESRGWPKEAVHCIYHEHKGGVTFYGAEGDMVKNGVGFIDLCIPDVRTAEVTREQYEAALTARKPEWNGEGLPPVGCRIEYTCKQPDTGHPAIEAGKWYGGTIIAYYGEGVWTSDNGIRHLSNTIFRPLHSEEYNKRYAAIEALFEILDDGVSTSQDSIDIYEAIAAGKIPHIRID